MEPRYLWLLNYCTGICSVIKLTNEDVEESVKYDNFEFFISEVLEEKYDFNINDCCWMTTDTYEFERLGF